EPPQMVLLRHTNGARTWSGQVPVASIRPLRSGCSAAGPRLVQRNERLQAPKAALRARCRRCRRLGRNEDSPSNGTCNTRSAREVSAGTVGLQSTSDVHCLPYRRTASFATLYGGRRRSAVAIRARASSAGRRYIAATV